MKLKIIFLTIGFIGLALFLYSLSIPQFKDELKIKEIVASGQGINSNDHKKMIEYYEQVNALKTNKLVFKNLGIGLFTFSLISFFFLIFNKIKKLSDFRNLKTFRKKTIFLSANLITIVIYIFTIAGMYLVKPPEYDISHTMFNIYSPTYLLLIFLIFFFLLGALDIFISITSIKSIFPSYIFIFPSYRRRKEIIWEIFWCICLLILTSFLIRSIIGGAYTIIIALMFYIYVLLMLRAGKINKWKGEAEKANQNII